MTRTVFMFPGQGSQKVGMGRDFVDRYPELQSRYFDAADEILGFPISTLCFEGPEEDLRRTDNTQPAIFLVSMAILDVLRANGVEPAAVAGHSLGEYSALVCAGVLDFADGLRLVRRRGELMAGVDQRTPGAMAAIIGPPPEAVEEFCAAARESSGGIVEPANYNEPEQTVISGQDEPVEAAMSLADEAGARVVKLQVGAPFHCSLMDVLADEFAAALDACTFRDPTLPVVANVTGDYVRTADEVKAALHRQVAGSVQWTATLRLLAGDGYDTFVEVGPGRVLSGFSMKVNPDLTVHSAGQVRRLEKVLPELAG
ncbi:MAG: ACP S-malonyltransferase [Egibacteraceae bacterium]